MSKPTPAFFELWVYDHPERGTGLYKTFGARPEAEWVAQRVAEKHLITTEVRPVGYADIGVPRRG